MPSPALLKSRIVCRGPLQHERGITWVDTCYYVDGTPSAKLVHKACHVGEQCEVRAIIVEEAHDHVDAVTKATVARRAR